PSPPATPHTPAQLPCPTRRSSDLIPDYARGKRDPSTVSYPHPLLEQSLKETYGIIVYQEQVMECAKIIAGYTLGGADMLRRAMGDRKSTRLNSSHVKTSYAVFCLK